MFVLGIFVDNQLAPQAHLSEGKFPTTSKKTPSPTRGRWILRQMALEYSPLPNPPPKGGNLWRHFKNVHCKVLTYHLLPNRCIHSPDMYRQKIIPEYTRQILRDYFQYRNYLLFYFIERYSIGNLIGYYHQGISGRTIFLGNGQQTFRSNI